MSSKTTNYNLHKIDLADSPPDITVLNQNWDTIDAELKELVDGFENLDASQLKALSSELPTITDANTSIADSNPTGIKIERWSKTTLNTPYTQGLTTRSDGVVITAVIKGTFATQLSFPIGGRGLYIRHNIVGSIYAWTEYGDFKADGSVPMTGEVLTMSNGEGSIENNGISASIRVRNVANDDSNSVQFILDNSFRTAPYSKLLLRETVDGVKTDYKLYGEHNKPTASDVGAMANLGRITQEVFSDASYATPYIGTVIALNGAPTGGQFRMMYIPYFANTEGFSVQVLFGCVEDNGLYWRKSHGTTWQAWNKALDVTSNGYTTVPLYHTDGVNNYAYHGEHNKPRGKYTGNGSPTARQINTNGFGNIALLYNGASSNKGFAILTPHGGFYKETESSSIVGIASSSANFTEGVINLHTADVRFNQSSIPYYYQVL